MNAMKRFALIGTALMTFLAGCGRERENTVSSQSLPKASADAKTVQEIAQTGNSTPVPTDYFTAADEQGSVVTITYNSKDYAGDESDITKTAYVYLPYGYDETDTVTRYDICYLMHGWGGHEGEWFEYGNIKEMLDNMIEKGDIQPTIFVSPTFYSNNGTDFSSSVAQLRQFHRDFEENLMPAVEGQFHTYAESTSSDDLKASRDHRAFAGFSLGSVTTWLQFCYDSDYISYFLPMSGSSWYYGGYGDFQIEKNVDFIQQLVEDNDLDERGYFIYHAVGTNDTVKSQSIDMAEEMLSRSDVFTPDHYVFYQREGGQHDYNSCREFMYNALPLFFGGDTVKHTDDFTESSTVADVKATAAFEDFGRLLFPVDRSVSDSATLKEISNSSTYVWYNNIKPEKTVEIVNYLKNSAENGQQIFYNIYTEEEMQADNSLRDTGLFFFKGEDNAKFAICNAGGGFSYVGAMHDSFPHALELSKMGYNVFALIYRPDAPYEDLARAIEFIHDNADALQVDSDDYSLWGGSAGARMAATLGNADYLYQLTGRTDIGQAAAVIMQ